jgi:hypothetical protein
LAGDQTGNRLENRPGFHRFCWRFSVCF